MKTMGGIADTDEVAGPMSRLPTPEDPLPSGGTTSGPSPSLDSGTGHTAHSRAVARGFALVVLIECLYALWTASRGYFLQDDFLDFRVVRQIGFSGRLFEQPVFGHFVPGFNVVDYVFTLVVPYQWWLIVLIDVSLFGLSLVLLDRLLTSLFGRSWLTVALVAVAGASFSLVPSFVWWSTALEYLVAIPATLLACLFHIRYLRSGRLRDAGFGAVSIAVGFAFYDGLFVSVLFIVLMTVLFWPAGPGLRGTFETLAVHSRAWIFYAVPVALELAWRLSHPTLYVSAGSATMAQTFGFIGLSWTQTVVPLTVGIDAWLLPTHAARAVAGLLGQVGFIAFLIFTLVRRRSAWRAWVLFGATFFVGAALVGTTRAGIYGPGDASDVKYVALDAFLLMITVGFALLPVRACIPTVSVETRTPSRATRPAWSVVVICFVVSTVVLAYGTALVFDQNRDHESVGSHTSRQFFSTFASSWARAISATPSAYLWDTQIDPAIVASNFFPYDTASVTIGPLYPQVQFDKRGGAGYLLRADGSVVPAAAVTQAVGTIGAHSACTNPRTRGEKILVPLSHRLAAARERFGVVSYRSATGAVATEPDGTTTVFPRGQGTLIAVFGPGSLHEAAWRLPPGSALCVTGLKVVLPEPVG